tara:strand:- start:842 stop:1012 length:171 start_codon:yes stop_codon:yes gene_type:complete
MNEVERCISTRAFFDSLKSETELEQLGKRIDRLRREGDWAKADELSDEYSKLEKER